MNGPSSQDGGLFFSKRPVGGRGRNSLMPRRFWLVVLLAWLVACGSSAPPKAAADLQIGEGKGAALVAASANEAVAEDDVAIPVSADDPVRGSRLAYVTIVVFSDFQC